MMSGLKDLPLRMGFPFVSGVNAESPSISAEYSKCSISAATRSRAMSTMLSARHDMFAGDEIGPLTPSESEICCLLHESQ